MSETTLSPQQRVIACISNSMSSMLGRGARATMREAGKAAGGELWPELPTDVGFDEAARIIHDGVASLGGFGDLSMSAPAADGSIAIEFKDCAFSQLTISSGQSCGEQAICYFGFGLVEETLRRLTGSKMVVSLIEHDDRCNVCHERATPR